ncbi:serine protease inhibitor ecotin [Orbaceae bacterium ESL0727]|nr:serine protease inhibitor ecotin [Orbaceae bacterium ESL0727]
MRKIIIALSLGVLMSSACATIPKQVTAAKPGVQKLEDIAPYPVAKDGYSRFVINVPPRSNENNVRIELVIGKDMQVDCNVHKLGGLVKPVELQGWGYSYYVVDDVNDGISTMMACPTAERKTEFVELNHNLAMFNYNSKLPIVVYAPSNLQVKYRLWTTSDKSIPATIE